jgi:hypothetical protein
MSLKMQADINLLQAHYNELSDRLDESEDRVKLLNRAIDALMGVEADGSGKKKLQLRRTDRVPVPRDKGKR